MLLLMLNLFKTDPVINFVVTIAKNWRYIGDI